MGYVRPRPLGGPPWAWYGGFRGIIRVCSVRGRSMESSTPCFLSHPSIYIQTYNPKTFQTGLTSLLSLAPPEEDSALKATVALGTLLRYIHYLVLQISCSYGGVDGNRLIDLSPTPFIIRSKPATAAAAKAALASEQGAGLKAAVAGKAWNERRLSSFVVHIPTLKKRLNSKHRAGVSGGRGAGGRQRPRAPARLIDGFRWRCKQWCGVCVVLGVKGRGSVCWSRW